MQARVLQMPFAFITNNIILNTKKYSEIYRNKSFDLQKCKLFNKKKTQRIFKTNFTFSTVQNAFELQPRRFSRLLNKNIRFQ